MTITPALSALRGLGGRLGGSDYARAGERSHRFTEQGEHEVCRAPQVQRLYASRPSLPDLTGAI